MKRSISLILAIAVVFCFCMVPVSADDVPTATLTATLVGDTVPQAGESFTVSVDFSDVSTNLIKSAQVGFSWPTDVASLYAKDYDVVITSDDIASYAVEVNASTYETTNALGITTTTDRFDTALQFYSVADGTGDITIYLPTNIKEAEALEDGTYHFCDISFILGEDQSYDDFYFEFGNVIAYFTEFGTDIESNTTDGTITTVGIEPVEEVVYTSVAGQNAEGIYTLPTEITSGVAEVEFDLTIAASSCNTLIGFNAASNMTSSNYFGGSSVMFLVNNGYLLGRNGGTTDSAALAYTVDETYHVSMTIDMDAQTWTATVTDSTDTVVWTYTDYAFRTSTDVIDSLVLVDNNNLSETLTVTNLVITVDETEEPTEATSEDETEEPTDEETEEPTDEETETPTEEETEEPTEETTYPEGAIVATAWQTEDGIHALDETITTTGTVSFKLVIDSTLTGDTLVSLTNADAMTSNTNYFANAGTQFMISGTTLKARIDGSTDEIGTLVSGDVYDVVVTIDVTNQTWSAVVTDAEGNEVATVPETAFRCESALESIDAIALLDNAGNVASAYVYDIVVEAAAEEPTDEATEEPTDEETEEPTDEETEEPTDEETEEPTEEETLPEDAVVSVTGQSEEAIVALDTAITTTGTVEFTLVVDTTETNDTLVALTNGDAMAANTNYFANAGVQFMVSGTTLKARIDGNTETIGTVESGVEYTFTVSVDVENQTWSAVVTDAEGNEVATVDETAFRCESALESIDSIVILDNAGGVESAYAYAITVTAESTGDNDEELPVIVTDYTYTDGGQVIATVGLADDAEEPTDTIVYIVSFTKDGSPLGIVAGEIAVGGTINVSNSDSTGVAAISFVTGISVEDVSPVDGDSDLGTPVGVYTPAE